MPILRSEPEIEVVGLMRAWREQRVSGSVTLNFSQGTLVSLDLRETRRVPHTAGPGEKPVTVVARM